METLHCFTNSASFILGGFSAFSRGPEQHFLPGGPWTILPKKCNTACSLWAPRVRRRQPRCGVSVPPTRLLLPGPHRCSEKLRVLPSSHMAWSFICGAKLKCALLVSILPADSDPAFGSTCRRVRRMPGPCNCTAWRAGHIAVPNDAHYLAATAAGGCGSRSRREIM